MVLSSRWEFDFFRTCGCTYVVTEIHLLLTWNHSVRFLSLFSWGWSALHWYTHRCLCPLASSLRPSSWCLSNPLLFDSYETPISRSGPHIVICFAKSVWALASKRGLLPSNLPTDKVVHICHLFSDLFERHISVKIQCPYSVFKRLPDGINRTCVCQWGRHNWKTLESAIHARRREEVLFERISSWQQPFIHKARLVCDLPGGFGFWIQAYCSIRQWRKTIGGIQQTSPAFGSCTGLHVCGLIQNLMHLT